VSSEFSELLLYLFLSCAEGKIVEEKGVLNLAAFRGGLRNFGIKFLSFDLSAIDFQASLLSFLNRGKVYVGNSRFFSLLFI
jgi:hypothetical protein